MSIFFPAYNDWGTIASLVVLAAAVARELTDDWEIIVVNDASPDHTPMILDELRRYVPRLRVVAHERNRGYGGALRSGFAAASKEYVFYTDGDAQYDVRELRALWENRADADLVNGYKIARSDPLHRIIIGRIYHHIVRLAFRLHVADVDCDFRLLRRSIFDRIELTRDSGVICVELMTKIEKNGFRIAEVPVHHYHRLHGRSQFFNFRRVFQVVRELGVLWWELIVQRKVTRTA
ncbi:MAG TPA: glycosyltransferase family 2 protein [Candidatus Nitrosopolaris sp.]|nr:glycosyltransferase family 2 protein [Candidatus Nitrosopolaris sp.]